MGKAKSKLILDCDFEWLKTPDGRYDEEFIGKSRCCDSVANLLATLVLDHFTSQTSTILKLRDFMNVK